MESRYARIRRFLISSSVEAAAVRSLLAAVIVGVLVCTMAWVPPGDNAWPICCVVLLACSWFGGLGPSIVAPLVFIFSVKAFQQDRSFFDFSRKELIDNTLLLLLTTAVGWAREVWRQQAEQLQLEARRKDQFLATLAHELRNPLAALRNGLELLKISNGDESIVCGAQAMMERQTNSMVRLIDDLLDVSRINSGKIVLQLTDVPVGELVEEAVEATRWKINDGKHDLQIAVPDSAIDIRVDRTRISQVLQNLLINAAKFTPPGGKINLSADFREGCVEIKVRDSGVGIPAADLPRIFEMFSQSDASRKRSNGGLGLGLHIVRTLVQMHGGYIAARSDGPGKGAEFILTLPGTQRVKALPSSPLLESEGVSTTR